MTTTDQPPEKRDDEPDQPSLAELMRDACGIVDSGIPDLSTNPKHMAGFGRDSSASSAPSA